MEQPNLGKESKPGNRGLARSEERKSWGEVPRLGDPKKALGLSRQPGDLWDYVGRYLVAIGLIIWVVFLLGIDKRSSFIFSQLFSFDTAWIAPALLLGLSLFISGIAFQFHGRKVRAATLNKEIGRMEETRPPVLYLRSFQSDKRTSRILGRALSMAQAIDPWKPWDLFGSQDELETEEESLARVVNEIGPLVAIGRPGEKLPQLGAARMYVGNEEWQARVTDLLSQARLVLLRPGETAGFWWEFERCAKSVNRDKLVLLLPFNRWEYERFRQKAQGLLRCTLPEYKGLGLFGTLKAVLYFDSEGVAHLRREKGRLDTSSEDPRPVQSLKNLLLPVGQRFGLRWE